MSKKRTSSRVCVCGNPKSAKALLCQACRKELNYYLARRCQLEGIYFNKNEFVEHIKERGFGDAGTCAICGGNYVLGGNNPFPVVKGEDACCCTRCNEEVVIPARLKEFVRRYEEEHEQNK